MKSDDLILVTDMQNVYRDGQPWACRDTDGAARNILKILDKAENGQVIFTKFMPPENPVGAWKVYNEKYKEINESEFLNELVPKLKDVSKDYRVYEKSVYSSLAIPEVLKEAEKAGRVVLTGVVAECCVLSTAFHAIDKGCHVVYITDAVSGLDEPKEQATILTLSGLSPVHTTICTTEEFIKSAR